MDIDNVMKPARRAGPPGVTVGAYAADPVLVLLLVLVLVLLLLLPAPDPESDFAGVVAAVLDSEDFDPESESPPDFEVSVFAASPAGTDLPLLPASSVFAVGLAPLFLKSVAYQPEPFN